jgi:hypothetical protein
MPELCVICGAYWNCACRWNPDDASFLHRVEPDGTVHSTFLDQPLPPLPPLDHDALSWRWEDDAAHRTVRGNLPPVDLDAWFFNSAPLPPLGPVHGPEPAPGFYTVQLVATIQDAVEQLGSALREAFAPMQAAFEQMWNVLQPSIDAIQELAKDHTSLRKPRSYQSNIAAWYRAHERPRTSALLVPRGARASALLVPRGARAPPALTPMPA